MSETTKGNPEIGMKANSIEAAAQQEEAKVNSGSVDSFLRHLKIKSMVESKITR